LDAVSTANSLCAELGDSALAKIQVHKEEEKQIADLSSEINETREAVDDATVKICDLKVSFLGV